jgi:hypothetical protein
MALDMEHLTPKDITLFINRQTAALAAPFARWFVPKLPSLFIAKPVRAAKTNRTGC